MKITKSPFSENCSHFFQNIGGARAPQDPLLRTPCIDTIPNSKYLIEITRVCKNPVKFISGWPGLFAGLEILDLVRPVVLEADPGPSGPVYDQTPEFWSSGGFSGGKEKVKKNFF